MEQWANKVIALTVIETKPKCIDTHIYIETYYI